MDPSKRAELVELANETGKRLAVERAAEEARMGRIWRARETKRLALENAAPLMRDVLRDLEEANRQVVHGERTHVPAEMWIRAQEILLGLGNVDREADAVIAAKGEV